MVAADRQRRARLELRLHRVAEFEAQEVHGRRLLGGVALEVLVGDRVDRRLIVYPQKYPVLDADDARERRAPLRFVFVFDLQRCLQIAAVRHERQVRVELGLDAVLVEYFLDVQHFVDLIANRRLVLEQQAQMIADRHGAALFVRDHARMLLAAYFRVRFERQQRIAGKRHRMVLVCGALRCRRPCAAT
ncbi:hypothetical protein DM75_3414 [Burkholderia mallei]|nr:hypothetical protein DM75_3414 [Burkholderia mallei]